MLSIKHLIPESRYEKESLIKSFLLFFVSIEILLVIIAFLFYQNKISELRNELFLELKNYSYELKGDKFKVDVVPKNPKQKFYQLYEDDRSIYIIAPIPMVDDEVLKIEYPIEKFNQQIKKIKIQIAYFFIIFSVIVMIMSIFFAYYSLSPIRKSIQMINEFIRDIIHDINTPVSSILINLKILKMTRNDEELERIENSVKQLSSIYDNLKYLLKESEKLEKEINLKEIINKEIDTLKTLYPDIKIETDLQDIKIKTDETALKRIISNLLTNAFKHNTKNGFVKIVLNSEYLEITNSSKPLKNPDKVFDRYYKESQRGLGLGLSIVKKLADELGFKVEFSYKNGLTTVRFRFRS